MNKLKEWNSGGDDDYLNGGFNPGKRCINMWDDGCANGQLGGSGEINSNFRIKF